MVELVVDGESIELRGSPTIRFDTQTSRVDGTGGCNDFGGSFTYSAGELEIEDVYFTLVGCSLPVETAVDSALQDLTAGAIEVSGDKGQYVLEGSGVRATYILLED